MTKKKGSASSKDSKDEAKAQHSKDLEELAATARRTKELSDIIINRVDEKLAELHRKEDKWNKMMKQLEENSNKVGSKVILDVGGKRFATSKESLLRQGDSYFCAMLQSGKFTPEADGSYFIDRNPKYFAIILEYLRTGKLSIKHLNSEQVTDLKVELDYYQIDAEFGSSAILDFEHVGLIERWTSKKFGELLWRGSEHGFTPSQFHAKCDNKGATIVVAKSDRGYIFGGYASTAWDCIGNYSGNNQCFLFTISNPNGIVPTKFSAMANGYSMYCDTAYGPVFGGGHDMLINSQSCSFNFPNTYNDPTGYGCNVFTGSNSCTLAEIEVFEIK